MIWFPIFDDPFQQYMYNIFCLFGAIEVGVYEGEWMNGEDTFADTYSASRYTQQVLNHLPSSYPFIPGII